MYVFLALLVVVSRMVRKGTEQSHDEGTMGPRLVLDFNFHEALMGCAVDRQVRGKRHCYHEVPPGNEAINIWGQLDATILTPPIIFP